MNNRPFWKSVSKHLQLRWPPNAAVLTRDFAKIFA
jgi:hypothetical protein